MKNLSKLAGFSLTAIALSTIHATTVSVDVGLVDWQSPAATSGLVADGSVGDIYLRFNSEPFPGNAGAGFPNDASSFSLGSYTFTDTLYIEPTEIDLSGFNEMLQNGIDEYIQFLIVFEDESVTASLERKESSWFGTTTDLIGLDTPTATFRIDEVRVGEASDPNFANMVYYLDTAVNLSAVPEPATTALILACLSSALVGYRRPKRRLSNHQR